MPWCRFQLRSRTINATAQPYAGLDPDCVLDAVESTGLDADGRLLALNSFENRVYQIGLDDGSFVVAKFYRPGRWSSEAIEEEHDFSYELQAAELPVVAPLSVVGESLHDFAGFRFAVYPRRGGRAPDLQSIEHLEWMGRLLARIHNVGATTEFEYRAVLDRDSLVTDSIQAVEESELLPDHLYTAYEDVTEDLESALEDYDDALAHNPIRLHGDCHAGNVLWTDHGPHFVDLDDARSGPAMQDLWMLASDPYSMDALLEGYRQFREIDERQRNLIPALRAMRQVHHAGWIAKRWADPAFPLAFPFAAEPRWWQEHIGDLREALEAL